MMIKKWWWVIVAIIIIIVVGLLMVFRSSDSEIKTGFQFYVAPDDVLVRIDDGEPIKIASYGFKLDWESGDYDLELSADGFESQTVQLSVIENELTPVYASLMPITDEAWNIMSSDEMQLRGERVGGVNNEIGGVQLEEQYPFINKLPIYGQFYTIAPCQDGETMVICVSMFLDNDVQRANALNDIRAADIDESIRVIYRDN